MTAVSFSVPILQRTIHKLGSLGREGERWDGGGRERGGMGEGGREVGWGREGGGMG